jgi:23S rRNA pseudouridine2605 synthase
MRINKFISHNTKYSRREADKLIEEGRVNIDKKKVTDFSTVVKKDDKVFIDGKPVKVQTMFTVIVYNKPKGELVTKKDPQGRKTIYESLPSKFHHFIPVGRLDFASEGVLLMTDSPKVAEALMNSTVERTYNIKIKGNVTNSLVEGMTNGVTIVDSKKGAHEKTHIEDMVISPFYAYKILKDSPTYSKLRVMIGEGKNRELRRFFAHFDREVVDLKRVAYGTIELSYLPTKKSRYLEKKEYEDLREFLKEYEKMKKEAK